MEGLNVVLQRVRLVAIVVLVLVLASNITAYMNHGQGRKTTVMENTDPSTWTLLDASDKEFGTVGSDIGSHYDYDIVRDPWYSDTVIVNPDTNTTVIAWVRFDVDSDNNDYIYMAFLVPKDIDNDGKDESYQKIIKLVSINESVKSLDSITIGKITIGGTQETLVLLTWTYYNSSSYYKNVRGAIYTIYGKELWEGDIAYSSNSDEYSRSCYVPGYNGGNGGFLIVWYNYDTNIYYSWLYYDDNNNKWVLTTESQLANTGLYERSADQMLCIGGSSSALVAYRVWDSNERKPDLYYAIVPVSGSISGGTIYDSDGYEETVGVHGDYLELNDNGYFAVPFVSGSYKGYAIIDTAGSVLRASTYDPNDKRGYEPYIVAAGDRFVMVWRSSDGQAVRIGNIIPGNWYIYRTEIADSDAKHPIVAYDSHNDRYVVVWSGHSSSDSNSDFNVRVAILDKDNNGDKKPDLVSVETVLDWSGDNCPVGLGIASYKQYIVAFNDTSDGEEDLLAYVTVPDSDKITEVTVYSLPQNATSFKDKILNLIDNAGTNVYLAMAYLTDKDIVDALIDAKNNGVDVEVILDNATVNKDAYRNLSSAGITVINDSKAGPSHIMHDKFMVVDDKYVVVSTANFVPTLDKHNNTAIIFDSKAVAYFYKQEFLQMMNGYFGTNKTIDYSFIVFAEYNGRSIVLEGYFSPQSYGIKYRIPETIAGFIDRAHSNVTFAAMIFTTSTSVKQLYYSIINAKNNGIDVKGVFNEIGNVDTPFRRIYGFIDAGVDIAISNHPYTMHAKIFTIDDKTAIIGSWNPTGSATNEHDENILVIRDSITNGIAKNISGYVREMYNGDNFVRKDPDTGYYSYVPTHLIISKVMFKPDDSGEPNGEWVEIYNPTSNDISLDNIVIGDIDNLYSDSDDGLYRFPAGATIPAHGFIVIAYDGQKFKEQYGFEPTYEIAGTDPYVPDLVPYDTTKFTGSWNLDDNGDEVILAQDEDGFLKVIDAVWYGSSTYMGSGATGSRAPLDISNLNTGDGIVLRGYPDTDAISMNNKYIIEENPQPIPEPWIVSIIVLLIIGVVSWIIWKRRTY